MTTEDINNFIDNKIKGNEKFVRITYLEIIEVGVKKAEMLAFSFEVAQILLGKRYSVYRTNQKYYYNGEVKKVESNELLVGIKRKNLKWNI